MDIDDYIRQEKRKGNKHVYLNDEQWLELGAFLERTAFGAEIFSVKVVTAKEFKT